MGLRLSNGISPCFFTSLRGGVDRPYFCFFGENVLLLVREINTFRVHEMRSQLEVTEMLECKVNLTVYM